MGNERKMNKKTLSTISNGNWYGNQCDMIRLPLCTQFISAQITRIVNVTPY